MCRPRRYRPLSAVPFLVLLFSVSLCSQNRPLPGQKQQSGALRVVGADVLRGYPKQAGYCRAFAPQDWVMRSRPQGDTADLDGAGGRAHASWGMLPINTAMRAYYGDTYGPPDVATLALASSVSHSPARWTSAPHDVSGFFIGRSFETNSTVGTILYRAYPGPTPGQYVLGSFLSWVDKSVAHLLPIAQAVMISIQCQTHLRPAEPTGPLPRPGSGHKAASSESDSLKDYNVQLGTQWAHSPSTGEHYMLDYASQWNSNGPDGAGYYRSTGSNSYEKLETGW